MRLPLAVALFLALTLPAAAGRLHGTPAEAPAPILDNARAQVLATLGAPQTARFRQMRAYALSDGGWAVCGAVSSRNLTGLPMPWKPIFVRYAPAPGGGTQLARRIVDWPADVACRHLAMGWPLRARD